MTLRPLAASRPNDVYSLIYVITTKCQLYSIVSQILLLHKPWGNQNKFNYRTSLNVYYWYVKKPQCGYMEHGLYDIKQYVKNIAPSSIFHNHPLDHNRPLGAPAYILRSFCWGGREGQCKPQQTIMTGAYFTSMVKCYYVVEQLSRRWHVTNI